MNPSKLKVVELRAELAARGLDTKGNKAVLVDRLQEALDKENGTVTERPAAEEGDDQPADETLDTSHAESNPDESDGEHQKSESDSHYETCLQSTQEGEGEEEEESSGAQEAREGEGEPNGHSEPEAEEEQSQDQHQQEEQVCEMRREPQENSQREEADENSAMEVDPEKEIKKEKDGYEAEVKTEKIKQENDTKEERDIKEERDSDRERDHDRRDRKRKRSSSPKREIRAPKEDEPEIKESDVTLSWYDSDLNLLVDKSGFCKASPMSHEGFGFIWAGVRGTYGYTSGNLVFQVKLSEFCDVSHLENEPNPNVLRVGWSALGTSLQLGEEPLSYGYGGTGKVSVDCKFRDYGKPFGLNDVVTSYIDFSEDGVSISYAVNEEFLGEAFKINHDELQGKALAPHILTKNVKFEVNFGQLEEPWVPVQEGYTFVGKVPIEEAVAGPRRPEKRGDCEMIMMCGLPGAGKTYWANKHCAENPDKLYNVIGTNALIDKMKVMGLPRKANYSGRWDLLIEKCTKCLQKLMDVGCRRRRNFILDQTNVYPAAQKRKMRNFEGFIKKAVVIVPTDEEFKRRVTEREEREGKDVPDTAVMEMKANFTLPDKSIFSEVIYTELDEDEARKLVRKYNEDAVSAGYARKPPGGPPSKKFRGDRWDGGHGRHGDFRNRQGGGPPPGFRRGGGGGGGRGGGGGWNQRQGGGGDRWRGPDRGGFRSGGGGGFRQGDRGPGGGGGWRSGGGGGGGRPRDGGGYGDRRGGGGGYGDRRGGGGGDRRGGGGYNRDRPDRGPKGGPPSGGMKGGRGGGGDRSGGGSGAGSGGGMTGSGGGQWGGYQGQSGMANQQWGQAPQAAGGWQANQATAAQNQQWANYQQQWKGYNQGYNQQGYGANAQAANYNQYGNWQQYGQYPAAAGYNAQWGQNWQNWYAQNAANQQQQQTPAVQPPPAK